jgi:hypothetical protein
MAAKAGVAVLAGALASVGGAVHSVRAQTYDPVVDRDFALDLYTGSIIGSVRVIGMGGASVAIAQGSVGTLSNAAGPAVRRTTKATKFAGDFHIDGQSAAFADDFDNNGLRDTDESSSKLATVGLVVQYGHWGLGLAATTSSTQIVEDDGDETTVDGVLEPTGSVIKVILARSFLDETHTVGAGLRFGSLAMIRPRPGLDDFELFRVSGPSAEAGWVWRPREQSWRAGASGALPVRAGNVTVGDCDPLMCEGYVLPSRVEVPWTLAVGGAYRLAHTEWNTHVDKEYRDELALLVAADLVITGPVHDGYGLEAFARHVLQPSGRETVVSPRVGAEFEAIPGWVRVRAGSYWEPARFADVSGRLHGTAGADVRLFELKLFGHAYRPQLSFTIDAAPRYGNAGVSFGFWR